MDEDLSALRSVAHPVRVRILSMLTAQPMSAAEVARELDLTHANASYHLRVLHDAGELVVESQEKIRGGTAKRYRYAVGGNPERPAGLAQRTKGPGSSSDIEAWVTPETWQRAVDAITDAMVLLHEEARPPRTEGTIHISASTQAFMIEQPS